MVMKYIPTILMLVLVLLGVALLIQQQLVLSKIRPEYRSLIERYGYWEIEDDRKHHVQRVKSETTEPSSQTIEWRFFQPYNISGAFGFGFSGDYGAQFFESNIHGESLLKCHFELDAETCCHILSLFGEHKFIFADGELATFIRTNWDKLDKKFAEQESKDEPLVVELATIRIPASLKAEFLEAVPLMRPYENEFPERPIFQLFAGNEAVVNAKF